MLSFISHITVDTNKLGVVCFASTDNAAGDAQLGPDHARGAGLPPGGREPPRGTVQCDCMFISLTTTVSNCG